MVDIESKLSFEGVMEDNDIYKVVGILGSPGDQIIYVQDENGKTGFEKQAFDNPDEMSAYFGACLGYHENPQPDSQKGRTFYFHNGSMTKLPNPSKLERLKGHGTKGEVSFAYEGKQEKNQGKIGYRVKIPVRSRTDDLLSGKLEVTGYREIKGSNELERVENAVKTLDPLVRHFIG